MTNDSRFEKAFELFKKERYFQAHEAWEELWHQASGAEKELLQGLIQASVALHHHSKGNLNGARYLYPKAKQKLVGRGPAAEGVLKVLDAQLGKHV